MKTGLFVVIEGIDGSGKTSLINGLADIFESKKISFIKNYEPTRSNVFGLIARSLVDNSLTKEKVLLWEDKIKKLSAELLGLKKNSAFNEIFKNSLEKLFSGEKFLEIERQSFFIADRYFDLKDTIKPALSENKIVLQDRFDISSAAYAFGSEGIDVSNIFYLQDQVLDKVYCAPDIKIFLDVDPEEAVKRISASRKFFSFYESLKKLNKIKDAYLEALKFKEKEGKTYYYQTLSKSIPEVVDDVYSFIFPASQSL